MSIVGRSQLDNPAFNTAGGTSLYNAFEAMLKVASDDAAGRYQEFSAVANSGTIVCEHNFGVPFASLIVKVFTGTFPNFTAIEDPTLASPAWGIAADGTFPKTKINITAPSSGGPHTGMIWITQTALSDRETTSKLLTGFSSGAGTVAATDTILQAFNKIVGNIALKANIDSPAFTTKVTLPNGSAGTPAIGFTSDDDGTGTGLYRIGANNLGFAANGVLIGQYSSAGVWTHGPTAGFSGTGHLFYGSTTAGAASVDVSGNTLEIGSDSASAGRTNNTTKLGNFVVAHYANAEEPLMGLGTSVGTSVSAVWIGGGSASFNAATLIEFYTAANNTTVTGTQRGSISSAGLWTIGSSGGSQAHAVNGSLTATGDITAFSDRRLKRDIQTISNPFGILDNMRGVHYVRQLDGKQCIGFVAQELLEVLPQVVQARQDDENLLSVAYGNITALLVEAVKELKAEVRDLRKQLAQLGG